MYQQNEHGDPLVGTAISLFYCAFFRDPENAFSTIREMQERPLPDNGLQ